MASNATPFIHDDFLLQSELAKVLYHDFVKNLPIIDYHCHLPPDEIAGNRQFENITQVWLQGDHYKWRAMRTLGINEKYVTGNASDQEKFEQWAFTVPYTLRNPLFHWTHLELSRYFSINEFLSATTAGNIYQQCSALLNSVPYSTRNLITRMNVAVICTTDDPVDSLEHHKKLSKESFATKVWPAFRPDPALAVEHPAAFQQYMHQLAAAWGKGINNYADLLQALADRIDYFHQAGCRLSDHGLERMYFTKHPLDADKIFKKVMAGQSISLDEVASFKCNTLLELCRQYHARGWTQQFHLGALRNTNSRLLATLGPNTGFDSIGDFSQAEALALFLNELDKSAQLTRSILYNLNPADNEVMASMIGNFNDGSVKGKIQYGSAWWFLDQKDGMTQQLNALSNLSLLSCFIGMLTDSRSFLSFPRHEYFRRILCNLLGNDVANGELPHDVKWLGKIASDVCYYNAKEYFGF